MLNFKSIRVFLTLIFFSIMFNGCNYDTVTGSGEVNIPADPISDSGTISGIITDLEGNPVQGVAVFAGNRQSGSSDTGYFIIRGLHRNDRTVIRFRKDDYVSIDKYCSVKFGESIFLNITIAPQSREVNLLGEEGGIISQEDIQIEIPPLAFTYETANLPFREGLDFAATYIKSSSNQFAGLFTGEFIGSANPSATSYFFESYGMLELKYNIRNYYMADLVNSNPAVVTLNIPEELQANPPENLSVWYYDSNQVSWYEEGLFELDGDKYVGTTSHFTYLTWGNYYNESYVVGKAIDISGNIITNGTIIAEGNDYNCRSTCSVDENGHFNLRVKSSSSAKLYLLCNGNISSPYEISSTPSPGNTHDLGNVSFNNPIGSITLFWGFYPDDLDAHLLVPASNSGEGPFHVNFAERGDLYAYPLSVLRKDDNDSYGPEIIDLSDLVEGRYIYFVHNVSGENDGAFTYSDAIVKLEMNNRVYLFEIPENNEESCDAWHVFDFIVDSEGDCEVVLIDEMIDKRVLLSENSMNKYSTLPK